MSSSSDAHYHPFTRAVADGLRHRCGVKPGEHVLVACSGGADSVALLRALMLLQHRRGFAMQLTIGHINHRLRTDGSAEQDAAFVRQLGEQFGLEAQYTVLNPDQRPEGKAMANDEAWARTARYAALARMAEDVGAQHIATAHHADDQIETVLMRITRGTNLQGLSGIAWRRPAPSGAWQSAEENPIQIIRPALGADRTMALNLLENLDQPYRTDPTNHDPTRTRALLRSKVVPVLKQLQPSLGPVIQKLCDAAAPGNKASDDAGSI